MQTALCLHGVIFLDPFKSSQLLGHLLCERTLLQNLEMPIELI